MNCNSDCRNQMPGKARPRQGLNCDAQNHQAQSPLDTGILIN